MDRLGVPESRSSSRRSRSPELKRSKDRAAKGKNESRRRGSLDTYKQRYVVQIIYYFRHLQHMIGGELSTKKKNSPNFF